MNCLPSAVVLFAHGSRDPLWRAPIDAVAVAIRRQSPKTAVHCAFLELMAPDLVTVVDELVGLGHCSIRVVPMFLGVGRHAREDLPQLISTLRLRHPGVALELQPAIGEQTELTECMARIALSAQATDTTNGHN